MHLQESNRLEGQELLAQESSVKSIHEHLAWLVGDNYLGRSTTTILAG
jgi:hypothetical protein